MNEVQNRMLPVFLIETETLAEGWKEAVLKVFKEGFDIETEYGGLSKDASVLIHIKEPFKNKKSRIHPGDYVTSLDGKNYVPKVLKGSIDHKIGNGVTYTYHDRLFKYKPDKENPLIEIVSIPALIRNGLRY